MPAVRDLPILTETFDSLASFVPSSGAAYVYGTSAEERSAHSTEWEARAQNVLFAPVVEERPTEIQIDVEGKQLTLPLRSSRAIEEMWLSIETDTVYLDFTGLAHHVWAPLLRGGLATGKQVRAVYVEPMEYRYSQTPTQGEIFDLSERISGVAPLPGFASLARPEDSAVFVPLLGFEGTRFKYLIEQTQPLDRKIVPVVGVPGFRMEYPFHTYFGNRSVLSETKAWRNVRYARANCPFSAMYTLSDIAAHWPQDVIKIAPIGTKPHALGAVLFYLTSTRPVEIVYDHPVRSAKRTAGASRVSVYHVSALQFAIGRVRPTSARDLQDRRRRAGGTRDFFAVDDQLPRQSTES